MLPERVTTGVYRTTFTMPRAWKGTQIVLHVAGAESVHAVYINGAFAGYGTDSRLPSEYDVSGRRRGRQQRGRHRRDPLQRGQLHRGPGPVVDGWSAPLRPRRVETAGAHRRCALRSRLRPGDGHRHRQGQHRVAFVDEPQAGWTVRTTLRRPEGSPVGKPQVAPVPHEFAVPYVFTGHTVVATWAVPACAAVVSGGARTCTRSRAS